MSSTRKLLRRHNRGLVEETRNLDILKNVVPTTVEKAPETSLEPVSSTPAVAAPTKPVKVATKPVSAPRKRTKRKTSRKTTRSTGKRVTANKLE